MDSRELFQRVLSYQDSDRPPLFEDGIRDEVVKVWRKQGLKKQDNLEDLFIYDHREEIEPNLDPIPYPKHWPKTMDSWQNFVLRLNGNDPQRLPDDWDKKVVEWSTRDYPLILRIHRGYFLSMGVHGWQRFSEAIQLLIDNPFLVHKWMEKYAELACQLIEKILEKVQVDAALFSEPIGGNHGPLISPVMYTSFVLKSYQPIIDLLKAHGVDLIIYRTYANTRALLPATIKAGFNCLWACECDPQAMNYLDIRREFGKDLRLIGGIDSDSLRGNQEDIHEAVMRVVPELINEGGYIPLADGRVREDVLFGNYIYYRKLLEEIMSNR